jgi:hypothetical protein
MAIWSILLPFRIFLQRGIFWYISPVLVCCAMKNLATLCQPQISQSQRRNFCVTFRFDPATQKRPRPNSNFEIVPQKRRCQTRPMIFLFTSADFYVESSVTLRVTRLGEFFANGLLFEL